MSNYKNVNLEITKKLLEDLDNDYQFDFPANINLLEKTKIIKKNILLTLDTAYHVASISKDKNIFDTSSSMISIEKEIEKIKKDVVSIAVFGRVSSGKSSFLNSLIGEELLTVKEERATATITIIRHIDNFEGKEDGEVEIHYKTKNEILFDLTNAIEKINNHLSYQVIDLNTFPDNIDDILLKKDEYLKKVTAISRRKNRYLIPYIDTISLILSDLESQRVNLDKVITKKKFNNNHFLTNNDLSVFINKVVFYKDIELLKNIELIDTPGLGSSNQLDTIKSEEFIEKADIVMIITEAQKPMQDEKEIDIFDILEENQKNGNSSNNIDKVFIVINKIDDTEKNRDDIKNLLKESLDYMDISIYDENILFVSSLYEYKKRFCNEELDSLPLKNRGNIGKEDIKKIEQTIYSFSVAEATSKFIAENIEKINKIFNDADRNFKNNLEKLDGDMVEIEKRMDKFKKNKIDIERELQEELEDITEDNYIVFKSKAKSYIDEIEIDKSNEKYFINLAKSSGKFKKANKDKTSSFYYKTIARELMDDIIKNINKKIENKLKNEVFSKDKIDNLKKKLQDKTIEIQKQYENDYGIVLNLDEIEIEPFNIQLKKNIDLNISLAKKIKQFFNIFIWGDEDKYIDISAEVWEKDASKEYFRDIKELIKNKANDAKNQIIDTTNSAITDIVNSIDNQLKQELNDYELTKENKEEMIKKKEIVQDIFKKLHSNYIAKAKEQNTNLFK